MTFSTVNLFTIKFIFRCGAILGLTREDLDRSLHLGHRNTPFIAKCR